VGILLRAKKIIVIPGATVFQGSTLHGKFPAITYKSSCKTPSPLGTEIKLVKDVTEVGLERPTDGRGSAKRPQNLPYDHRLQAESKHHGP